MEPLKNLFQAGGVRTKLVFISSCSSELTGNAFVEAGVPHVVAVKREESVTGEATPHSIVIVAVVAVAGGGNRGGDSELLDAVCGGGTVVSVVGLVVVMVKFLALGVGVRDTVARLAGMKEVFGVVFGVVEV